MQNVGRIARADAGAAVQAAVARGRIDVLVNNAASFYAGYFEELTPVFRTELLTDESTQSAEQSIADDDERRGPLVDCWKAMNGTQSGDPAKLARALITISDLESPPQRRADENVRRLRAEAD